MVTRKVVEITVEEARQMLVDYYCDILSSGDCFVRDLIRYGFSDEIPVVNDMKDYVVADQVGEFNLGENIAKEHDADIVMVRLNSITSHLIYDRNDPGCNGPSRNEAAVA